MKKAMKKQDKIFLKDAFFEKITVKEPPVSPKQYNSFSRPCRDDMPHPKCGVFTK